MFRTMAGAAELVADGASQLFDVLVERGRAVRPGDGTLAGSVTRALVVDVPSNAGHALGAAVNAALGLLEQVRGAAAIAATRLEQVSAALCRHAGLPTQEDFDEMRGRLEHVAAALEAIDARPAAPPPVAPAPEREGDTPPAPESPALDT